MFRASSIPSLTRQILPNLPLPYYQVRFLAWLEAEIGEGKEVTEWEAAQWLDQERTKAENNMGQAYGNISASGPNAALPHYVPTRETARVIDTKTPYLK